MHRDGSPEFEATYFSLRVGLVFSAILVLAAPVSVWIVQGEVPPTISDSWYTPARSLFVVGLAISAGLLLVVRGDTLTEQTLLNIAGALAVLTAANGTQPIGPNGELLPFDPTVMQANEFALSGVLAVAVAVSFIARVLPPEFSGGPWSVDRRAQVVLNAVTPVLIVSTLVAFLANSAWVARHVHSIAAVAMFAALSGVAFLRTSWGLRLLASIGDRARPDSMCDAHLRRCSVRPAVTWEDRVYAAIALGMIATALGAAVLLVTGNDLGVLVFVEAVLILLFMAFWIVQTTQAWRERSLRLRTT